MDPTLVSVRYMVDDVDAALAFYTTHPGFKPLSNAAPALPMSHAAISDSCSAGEQARRGVRCLMGVNRVREAGTGST